MGDYEERMEQERVEHLPHGTVLIEEGQSEQANRQCTVYTYVGYLEPTGGWLHIHEDNGQAFSFPRERVIKIRWDKRWKINRKEVR